jgi:hypothetical protein
VVDVVRARWIRADGTGVEEVAVRAENAGLTAEGVISDIDVQYVIRLDETWQVRQLLLFRDLDEPDLWLATDQFGRWGEVNGAIREELAGCVVAAVAGSAFAHALALRAGSQVDVAVVDPETLGVEVVRRSYEQLGPRRWRHEGHEWDVDDDFLPLDLPGSHHRVG